MSGLCCLVLWSHLRSVSVLTHKNCLSVLPWLIYLHRLPAWTEIEFLTCKSWLHVSILTCKTLRFHIGLLYSVLLFIWLIILPCSWLKHGMSSLPLSKILDTLVILYVGLNLNHLVSHALRHNLPIGLSSNHPCFLFKISYCAWCKWDYYYYCYFFALGS